MTRFINNVKKQIRHRLYSNITPFGYQRPLSRSFSAVVLNRDDDLRDGEDELIKSNSPESSALDLLWAQYLGIPKSQRRKNQYSLIKNSDGSFRFNDPSLILNFGNDLSPRGLYSSPGRKAIMMNGILGNHGVGLSRDAKGDYIYYTDSSLKKDGTPDLSTGWDINPYSKTVDASQDESSDEVGQYGQQKKSLSYRIGKLLFGNKEDVSMGIGKPIPIYDKIYLDDYYDVPHQGAHYLPEITITRK